jgi:anti-sigma28 factor (negative regulator of flagellin synthesis)
MPAFVSPIPGYNSGNCERSVMAAKKTSTTATKKTKRRYGPKASATVKKTMEEMKAGKLRSGGSGKKVTDPKQAIAIGLSEARRNGAKVPEPPE